MSLSSNVTIFYQACELSAVEGYSVGPYGDVSSYSSNEENLIDPVRQKVATLHGVEMDGESVDVWADPAVALTVSGAGSMEAIAFVDCEYTGTVAVKRIRDTQVSYYNGLDLDTYLGGYQSGILGQWEFDRHPTSIVDLGCEALLESGDIIKTELSSAIDTGYDIARIMPCRSWSPSYNFDFGWSAAIIDNSQTVKSIGGQSWTAKKSRQWQVSFDLSAMGTVEALGELAAIAWKLGTNTDCVLALTPNADTADILTLYGRFTKIPTFTNSNYGMYDTQLIFTESL